MDTIRFFVKENALSAVRSITIPFLLLVSIAFVVAYSLAYPSYLEYKERSTEDPPWSAEINFTFRSRAEVDELNSVLAGMYPDAKIVDSCMSESLVSGDSKALDDAANVSLKLVPTRLLNQPDRRVFPADVYVPKSFVLDGDPYSEEGLIIDALTAQRLGVSAKDMLYVGLLFPEGSRGAQSVPIPDGSSGGQLDIADNIVFSEIPISAVVKPSSMFEGIALFQPSESVQAYEQDGSASCTQLYVLGIDSETVQTKWIQAENQAALSEVYLESADEEVQWAKDSYARDRGGVKTFVVAMVVGLIAILAFLTLDGFRRLQNQMRSMIVFLALGEKHGVLLRAFFVGALTLYAVIAALGCIAGFVFAVYAYPIWVPVELKATVVLAVFSILLLAAACQCGILSLRMQRMNILGLSGGGGELEHG